MRIEINQNWAIDFDGTSYMPTRLSKVTAKDSKRIGEETEKVLGYFKDLGNAVDKIIQTGLGDKTDTVTLKQYIEAYTTQRTELLNLLKSK